MGFAIALFTTFSIGYLLNIFFITVLYHRGLSHGAVELTPRTMHWLSNVGIWVTGIDPKAWACMHRLHHLHSDTKKDPHSPKHLGVFGVALGQLRSYERILRRLIRKEPLATALVADIPFEVSLLNRNRLWMLPYLLQMTLATAVAWASGSWLIGLAYYLGIMSHPAQGWMVNSLAHAYGYRNFEIEDHSKNNTLVGYLVFGEGLQNNHHRYPQRAHFAMRWFEVDLGYLLCLAAEQLGLLHIPKAQKKPLSTRPRIDLSEALEPLGF